MVLFSVQIRCPKVLKKNKKMLSKELSHKSQEGEQGEHLWDPRGNPWPCEAVRDAHRRCLPTPFGLY